MIQENRDKCFGEQGVSKCTVLTKKNCKNCKFRMTNEDYIRNRLKYAEKEISYLDKIGASTIEIRRFIKTKSKIAEATC